MKREQHNASRPGSYRHEEYRIWNAMKRRCDSPNGKSYHRYGGRGISVCQEWRESFNAFMRDMGPRPSLNHTIERIDNDGNYEPGNCRWATRHEQGSNKSNNRVITHGGRSQTISQWSRETGLSVAMIQQRLDRHGMSVARALDPKLQRYPTMITARGRTQSLADWSREVGLTSQTLCHRLYTLKLPPDEAIFTPKGTRRPDNIKNNRQSP